ncbi:MAG TPA: cupin domain-containing protein [Prolixibacteraceae bacterium]|nr:cupin domain-containing protein [Prolixibacteraceae bacterium]
MKKILKMSLLLLTVFAFACNRQKPQHIQEQTADSIFPKGEKITNNNFAGTAYLQMMGATDTTLHASYGNVTFEPKARTNWHSHPGGQILFITKGKGFYQAKDQPAQLLHKGDVVEIPRNITHWHGAAPDSEFAHIAVSLNTDEGGAVWIGPVTDEEYNKSTK